MDTLLFTWDAEDAGCIIAGSLGQYGVVELLSLAVSSGCDIPDVIKYGNMDQNEALEYEWIGEVADDAEAWLNENAAPEGYSFGWHDGEFFLWSNEQWGDEA